MHRGGRTLLRVARIVLAVLASEVAIAAAAPIDSCLVGVWRSEPMTGASASGGGGIVLTFGSDGVVTIDYSETTPIQARTGEMSVRGAARGRIETSAPGSAPLRRTNILRMEAETVVTETSAADGTKQRSERYAFGPGLGWSDPYACSRDSLSAGGEFTFSYKRDTTSQMQDGCVVGTWRSDPIEGNASYTGGGGAVMTIAGDGAVAIDYSQASPLVHISAGGAKVIYAVKGSGTGRISTRSDSLKTVILQRELVSGDASMTIVGDDGRGSPGSSSGFVLPGIKGDRFPYACDDTTLRRTDAMPLVFHRPAPAVVPLPPVPQEALDACVVGQWRSQPFRGQRTGGEGVLLTIEPSGMTTIDFDSSTAIRQADGSATELRGKARIRFVAWREGAASSAMSSGSMGPLEIEENTIVARITGKDGRESTNYGLGVGRGIVGAYRCTKFELVTDDYKTGLVFRRAGG